MNLVDIPSLYDSFDVDSELELFKARVVTLSNGKWTDTSAGNPGIVAGRVMLEFIGRWVYASSVRYLAETAVLQLARLTGHSPLEAVKAEGMLSFTVAPNTTIQAGFQVADETKGASYETKIAQTSVTGGTVLLEARALVAGSLGNTRDPGVITSVRSAPSSGQVLSVTNVSAFDGGKAAETVAEFIARYPLLNKSETVLTAPDFEAEALENLSVARAKAYRATKPTGVLGQFAFNEADYATLVLVGPNGASPSQSVLDAVRDSILSQTLFNLEGATPDENGLFVLGVRSRVVGVTLSVIAEPGADLVALNTAIQAAVTAYLQPLSGGDNQTGFELGRPPRVYEIGRAVEAVSGVNYIVDNSIILSNAASFSVDELVSPGTVTVNLSY